MTVEDRLARIDTTLALLDQRLKDHSDQDEDNFNRLSRQLESIAFNVDKLRLDDAERKGATEVAKRNAGIFGGGVAASIVAIAEAVRYFLNVK